MANSGDSRAVLYRGKEPMALSVDHKVTGFRLLHRILPLLILVVL